LNTLYTCSSQHINTLQQYQSKLKKRCCSARCFLYDRGRRIKARKTVMSSVVHLSIMSHY